MRNLSELLIITQITWTLEKKVELLKLYNKKKFVNSFQIKK